MEDKEVELVGGGSDPAACAAGLLLDLLNNVSWVKMVQQCQKRFWVFFLCAVLFSAVQCSIVQSSAVHCSAVQCRAV